MIFFMVQNQRVIWQISYFIYQSCYIFLFKFLYETTTHYPASFVINPCILPPNAVGHIPLSVVLLRSTCPGSGVWQSP